MSHQDWKVVTLHGNKNKVTRQNKKKDNKKKQNLPGTKLFRKLDGNEEIITIEKVGRERGIELSQARNAKKLKQKDVANRLSLKQSLINDWETGKAVFSKGLYVKLKRLYGLEIHPNKKKKLSKKASKKVSKKK